MFEWNITGCTTIGYIQVVGLGRIFGSQGINLLDNWQDAHLLTYLSHLQNCLMHIGNLVFHTNGTSYLEISKTIYFRFPKQLRSERFELSLLQFLVNVDDMLQLIQEPFVYLCQLMNTVDIILWQMHRFRDYEDTLISRFAQSGIHIGNLQFLVLYETMHALSYHAQAFLDSLFKGTTNGHHLAYRFHG